MRVMHAGPKGGEAALWHLHLDQVRLQIEERVHEQAHAQTIVRPHASWWLASLCGDPRHVMRVVSKETPIFQHAPLGTK
jgi:hypothetical protein